MVLSASCDAIQALLVGAFTCLEMCKPWLALSLTSAAINMCQTLGYNRLSTQDPANDPERQRKVFLFWSCYIYDRNISLRVGRPASIPDFDVSTETLDDPGRFSQVHPGIVWLHRYWAEVADVQGVICSKLYSPVGLRQSLSQRTALVETLSAKLHLAWQRRFHVRDTPHPRQS